MNISPHESANDARVRAVIDGSLLASLVWRVTDRVAKRWAEAAVVTAVARWRTRDAVTQLRSAAFVVVIATVTNALIWTIAGRRFAMSGWIARGVVVGAAVTVMLNADRICRRKGWLRDGRP